MKQVLNVLLLCNMLVHDGADNVLFVSEKTMTDKKGEKVAPTPGFLTAI